MKKIILAVVVLACSACSSNQNKEYIAKVDQALAKIDKADSTVSGLDFSVLSVYRDTIAFDVKFIQREYSDTMNLDLATKVDVYYRTIKSINKFEATFKDQMEDLQYSRVQLQNLKDDLEKNIIDSSGFNLYFPPENQAVQSLSESAIGLESWYNTILSSYTKYKSPIDSVILDVKTRKGY